MSMTWRWLRYRLFLIRWIIRHDSTALAEVLSGTFLLALRGLVLINVRPLDVPFDVALSLYRVGITEQRWGWFILVCGIAQIALAGSRHSNLRLGLKLVIVTAFVLITMAYITADQWRRPVVPSLICMIGFYVFLMYRVFVDKKRGTKSLEEHHAHART